MVRVRGVDRYAKQIEQAGADALELHLLVPDPPFAGAEVEKRYGILTRC